MWGSGASEIAPGFSGAISWRTSDGVWPPVCGEADADGGARVLHERDRENRADKQERNQAFCVAREIPFEHGVDRPFKALDGPPWGKV